jgi:hypothetical protein
MKHIFSVILVFMLFGCEDVFKDSSHFSVSVTQSKVYPVYLDMSDIGKIQAIANFPLTDPFKILSDHKFIYVGEKLKGIHVYENNVAGLKYQCFIECRYITDFELADSRLFCNNLFDMVVLDVSNPLQTSVLHRQKNYFNQFTNYKKYWAIPYEEEKGIVATTESHDLTGMVSDKQPNLDFSAFDRVYGNLTTKAVPDSWFGNQAGNDRPLPALIKIDADEIYSYGSYNSWSICSFRSGIFKVREEDLWASPRGKYSPPYYYSNAYPVRMFLEDELIFNLGSEVNMKGGYCNCIIYHEKFPVTQNLYFPTFKPVDICYMPQKNTYFALSGTSIWGIFIYDEGPAGYKKTYKDLQVPTSAVEIFKVGDKIITLGTELAVYSVVEENLKLLKNYADISGRCCEKKGNLLTIADAKGLFIYDITDLENIKIIS